MTSSLTVDPDERRILVSSRIRAEFENGRAYYQRHRKPLAPLYDPISVPAKEHLEYHAQNVLP
jgi:putative restriction endonuclease